MPRPNINQLIENKMEVDKKFNEVIAGRVERLSQVAVNVLRKSGINRGLTENEINSCFPERVRWVFSWRGVLKSTPAVRNNTRRTGDYRDSNGIYIVSVDSENIHALRCFNGEVENFVIPVHMLKLSDREFAKLIRRGVKEIRRKEAYDEHVRRQKHIRDMKDAIAEMEETIAEKEKESARYKAEERAYVEEVNQRTRERGAQLQAKREQERLNRLEQSV